jgi:organic radical activating enzyme
VKKGGHMNILFDNYRNSIFRFESKEFLISKIEGSEQEMDLTLPPNCNGYGRIRHFKRNISSDWGKNPLPIDPAVRSLNLPCTDEMEAEVFQIASCNARCWYCFVPQSLEIADTSNSDWFTADKIIELFANERNNIKIIDLSGGNPELAPEWILETMKSLERRKLVDEIYLWSDDALTTDFAFKYLHHSDIRYMSKYKNYGKVCCFKGFDSSSFCFNTSLPSEYYDIQFTNFEKYVNMGFDIYGYVTFTTDSLKDLEKRMDSFISRLRNIHNLLPLRIVPLKIILFDTVKIIYADKYQKCLDNQKIVFHEWLKQLNKYYSKEQLNANICDISLV